MRHDYPLLEKNDQCCRRLNAKIEKLKAKPMPTTAQIAVAWKEVLKAYYRWSFMRTASQLRAAEIEELQAQIKKRMMEVVRVTSWRRIHALRQKMGNKFRRSPKAAALISGGSRPLIADALSSSQRVITPSPPASSA